MYFKQSNEIFEKSIFIFIICLDDEKLSVIEETISDSLLDSFQVNKIIVIIFIIIFVIIILQIFFKFETV